MKAKRKAKRNVLVISDTQGPFEHKDTLRFLKAVQRKYKCDTVVHVGDEADMHALSDYDHDPDGMSAGDEHRALLKSMAPFYKAFPNVMAALHPGGGKLVNRGLVAQASQLTPGLEASAKRPVNL